MTAACGRYFARPSSIPSASAVRTSCPRGIDALDPVIAAVIGSRFDPSPPQAHHVAELPRGDEVHRLDAESRREDAVEGRRRAAALQVPEHGDARLEVRAEGDLVGDPPPDPAEAAGRAVRAGLLLVYLLAAGGEGSLGDDDDAEAASRALALLDVIADPARGRRESRG